MKKPPALLVAALLLCITSCQKEIDWGTPANGTTGPGTGSGTGSGQGAILTRLVSRFLSDSTTRTFQYNGAGKLTAMAITGKNNGISIDQQMSFTRDGQGRITRLREIQVVPSVTGIPGSGTIDTTYTDFYFNGTDTKFLYSKRVTTQMGLTFQDSTRYTYAGMLVSKTEQFVYSPINGYELLTATHYTYDAGNNLTNVKVYDHSSGAGQLLTERRYIYDTRNSPLILGFEGPIATMEANCGLNNARSTQIIDHRSGTGNMTTTINFTYRPNNTPGSAAIVVSQGGANLNGTASYYYQ